MSQTLEKQLEELREFNALIQTKNELVEKSNAELREAITLRKAFKATTTTPAVKKTTAPKTVVAKTPAVRKNTRFGLSTWYLKSWQDGDRSAKQFGLLMGKDLAWITAQEAEHVRISMSTARERISKILS